MSFEPSGKCKKNSFSIFEFGNKKAIVYQEISKLECWLMKINKIYSDTVKLELLNK